MRLRPVLVGLAALLVGCATGVTTPPLVSGPHDTVPPWELFERVVESARAQGYEPEGVDLDRGVFRVRPRSAPQDETRFVTRFYQGGWVEVLPMGPGVRPEGAVSRVEPEMRREMVAYVQQLTAAMETDQ